MYISCRYKGEAVEYSSSVINVTRRSAQLLLITFHEHHYSAVILPKSSARLRLRHRLCRNNVHQRRRRSRHVYGSVLDHSKAAHEQMFECLRLRDHSLLVTSLFKE